MSVYALRDKYILISYRGVKFSTMLFAEAATPMKVSLIQQSRSKLQQ
jgi:hypothetical protein